MKKTMATLLVVIFLITTCACGNTNTSTSKSVEPPTNTEAEKSPEMESDNSNILVADAPIIENPSYSSEVHEINETPVAIEETEKILPPTGATEQPAEATLAKEPANQTIQANESTGQATPAKEPEKIITTWNSYMDTLWHRSFTFSDEKDGEKMRADCSAGVGLPTTDKKLLQESWNAFFHEYSKFPEETREFEYCEFGLLSVSQNTRNTGGQLYIYLVDLYDEPIDFRLYVKVDDGDLVCLTDEPLAIPFSALSGLTSGRITFFWNGPAPGNSRLALCMSNTWFEAEGRGSAIRKLFLGNYPDEWWKIGIAGIDIRDPEN